MPREIKNWRIDVKRDDFFNLGGGNVYVQNYGYLTDPEIVLPELDRSNPHHWDLQFQNAAPFQESWKPRVGPLNLVHNLVENRTNTSGPFIVFNLGAGLGDFTIDLARQGDENQIQVYHVDFSAKANEIAGANIIKAGVQNKVVVDTSENRQFLRKKIKEGSGADFVFYYGGLGENTPYESDIQESLQLGSMVLKPGGHMWIVWLEQPFLLGEGETVASDIRAEFPVRPGLLAESMAKTDGMYLVREELGERPDKHPLYPGGSSEDHMHIVRRALYVKMADGNMVTTPEFSFK